MAPTLLANTQALRWHPPIGENFDSVILVTLKSGSEHRVFAASFSNGPRARDIYYDILNIFDERSRIYFQNHVTDVQHGSKVLFI